MSSANGNTPKSVLKALAKESGANLGDLIVLAPANDPFNTRSKTDLALAEWFSRIYEERGFGRGVHLRRIHYHLASEKETVLRPDGKPYQNTIDSWNFLGIAAKKARYLGLVDADDFVDHRNPKAQINAADPVEPREPNWHIGDFESWALPRIRTDLHAYVEVPDIDVDGYEYDDGHQPYLLEVWAEKNTMNDVLEPVCEMDDVNFRPSLGFQSITTVRRLLGRCEALFAMDRPTRIFYISDFDPAGDCMPVAVARQLEFWIWKLALRGDVKLKPLVLTRAQVEEYDLPRKPIKDTDRRRGNFENRHGEGAVELDALEAIHPGELERIVEEAIRPYRDMDLESRLGDAAYQASVEAGNAWMEATEDIQNEAKQFQAEVQAVLDRYAPRLKKLNDVLQRDLAPPRKKMADLERSVEEGVEDAADSLMVPLPDRPEPEIEPPDESDWLFDSSRPYGDQFVHLELAELTVLELLTHTKRAQLKIAADAAHWRPGE